MKLNSDIWKSKACLLSPVDLARPNGSAPQQPAYIKQQPHGFCYVQQDFELLSISSSLSIPLQIHTACVSYTGGL